eukprot:g363.t1
MIYSLVILVLGYFFLKELWMRLNYDLHKIPTPPKLPILGHTLELRKVNSTSTISVWLQEWREKLNFPKLMRLCIREKTVVVVTDMDLARKLAQSRSDTRLRQGAFYRQFQRLLMGDDDLTPCTFTTQITTPYVKTVRRIYAESFISTGLKKIFDKQIEVMNKGMLYLKARQNDDEINIEEFFGRLILDSAGKAELDLEIGGLDNSSPIYKLLQDCGYHMRALSSIPFFELRTKLFPNSKTARKIRKDFNDLLDEWTKITNEICNRGEPDEEDISVAANLRRAQMPGTDEPIPFNLLRGELATAIVGGFETTSHQLSWIFALLASNPFVVDKLLDELKTRGLYGDGSRDLKFEDLSELEYLTAVIKEGMRRIHTVTFVSGRAATQDLVLGGYRIPKGTLLATCSNLLMNCEPEWEDHLAFKPERWLHGDTNIKEKYYIPFGLGERDCAGMRLAMQSMKLAIVYFVTRFSFELVGDKIDSLVKNGTAGIVFKARNGINMKITPRVMK